MGALSSAIAGNAALASLRSFIVLVCATGVSVLVSRALGPEDFGEYRLALGLIWGLEVVSVLGFPTAITKFVAEHSGDGAGSVRIIGFFLRTAVVIYLIAGSVFLVFQDAIAGFYRDPALGPLLVIGTISVLPGLVAGMLSAGLTGHARFGELARLGFVQSVVSLVATAALFALGFRVRGLMVLLLLLNVFNMWLVARALAREGDLRALVARPPRELSARMWRYGALMAVIALLGAVVWERSEIFFLGRFATTAEVGFYSLAYTLALQARRLVPVAFGEVLLPVISKLEGLGDQRGVALTSLHATRYLAMVGVPLAVGGVVFAEPIVRLLFGAPYLPMAPVLAVLMVAAGVMSISQPATAVILSKERFRFLIVYCVLLAAANVIADLLLIPTYAAIGAAVANSAVQIVGAVIQIAFVCRMLRTKFPLGSLARCSAATLLACAPAALLTHGGADAGTALGALVITAFLYPVALATTGALTPSDFEHLQALEAHCPKPAQRLVGRVLRGLRTCAS